MKKSDFLQKLHWVACVLAVTVSGISLFVLHQKQWMGLIMGCLLVLGNLTLWRWLLSTILPRKQNSGTENARFGVIKLVLIGQIKLVVIGALVVLAQKIANVDLKYVLAGLLLFPISIVVALGWASLENKRTENVMGEHTNG